MICLGSVINSALIILGGVFGLFFGRLLTDRIRSAILTSIGVCVMLIGLQGTIEKMTADYGPSSANKSVMLVVCASVGTLIGTVIDIDRLIERFGDWLKRITKSDKDAGFTNGFLTASVTVCIGAMAVIGSINDGVSGDISVLLVKSIIDMVTIMVMTVSMGKGCIFSAIPVLIVQGTITLLARIIAPYITDIAISNLSLVGSALIFCIGINLSGLGKIKVANMLPAIVLAIGWGYIPWSVINF